jgi:hypothetical protein
MFTKLNKFNSNECFQAINKFIGFSQEAGKDNLQSLDEIIAYHLDHKHQGILSNQSHIEEVAAIKVICDTKNQTTQSNLLLALTATCHKYAPDARIEKVLTTEYSPAKIMAAFHHEALTNQDKPIQFTAHLDQFSKLPSEQRAVILFCIKRFAPGVVFYDSFVDSPNKESNYTQFKDIVRCLTSKTSFTYTNECLGIMGRDERSIFLTSVSKASRLVLDGTKLDQWSANDWAHFIDKVEQNDQLSSISLNKNDLYQTCIDPEKFPYILKLFEVSHLTELNLHNNNLGNLPIAQFQRLQQAICKSPIPKIGLRHIPGTASISGLFAIEKPDLKSIDPVKKEKEGNTSTSGEFQIEGCHM